MAYKIMVETVHCKFHSALYQVAILGLFGTFCVHADYLCVCNYAVEQTVLSAPNAASEPVGYMYEFDCKPRADDASNNDVFIPIMFEHMLGYLERESNIEQQVCQGDLPDEDKIISTAPPSVVTTVRTTTTVKTTTPPTTITTTTPTTTSTTTPTTTSTTTTPTTTSTTTPTTTMTTTTQPLTTTPTDPWRYIVNVTGTWYQYVGIGYNLLTGNPEMGQDPGFLINKRILAFSEGKAYVSEATPSNYSPCMATNKTSVVYERTSLQDEMSLLVRASESHPEEVIDSSFTGSSEFQNVVNQLNNGTVYQDNIATCNFTKITYTRKTGTDDRHVVSREFATAICHLPDTFNADTQEAFFKLIDEWGTSIVVEADFGERNITRGSFPQTAFISYVANTDPSALNHGGPMDGYTSSLSVNSDRYSASSAITASLTNNTVLTAGNDSTNAVIGIDVVPISEFIDWEYMGTVLERLFYEGACPTSMSPEEVERTADNVKQALSQYPSYTGSSSGGSSPDTPYRIPVTWPAGTYGLMKPASGCPAATVSWATGSRVQTSQLIDNHNNFTSDISNYMAGRFTSEVETEFCIKTVPKYTEFDLMWPAGSYCILRSDGCPQGFQGGYVFWDDSDARNGNSVTGSLPDGKYNENTKIHYCCRNDGSVNTAISLPTDSPFILLKYEPTCQTVYGMTVTELFIYWDDDNELNTSFSEGKHPLDTGGYDDHLLHFCYYSSTTTV